MATDIDLVNIALSHLGNKANVGAIDPPDGSVEANWASRFWLQAVYSALEMEDWSFARKRAQLAPVALPLGTTWAYAYGMPSDCIKARRVLTGDMGQFEDDSEPFSVESGMLLTNRASAVLVYTYPLTDATKFPPAFGNALSYELAAYLAGPILKGTEGARAARDLRQVARGLAATAAANDGDLSERPQDQYVPSSVQARGAGAGSRRAVTYTGSLPSGFEII